MPAAPESTHRSPATQATASATPATATIALDSVLVGKIDIAPPEHDEERSLRLRHEGYDLNVARGKSIAMFTAALLMGGILFWCCINAMLTGSADDKRWATAIVSSAASALMTYLLSHKK
ncbi:MAG: hypothetical protein JOY84_05240 [Curvibacter sp.]|nr:hypothetical protein [Curvibacter sp.]